MEPFEQHTGIAVPLIQLNIDTDAIIPSREIKSVSKKGLEDGLFAEWRYLSLKTRKENPEFILNQEPYRRASFILTGENFGCGSSREHAVWALYQWGVRVIVAPSFGSIFYNNCIQNGIRHEIFFIRLLAIRRSQLCCWLLDCNQFQYFNRSN